MNQTVTGGHGVLTLLSQFPTGVNLRGTLRSAIPTFAASGTRKRRGILAGMSFIGHAALVSTEPEVGRVGRECELPPAWLAPTKAAAG